MLLKKMIFQRMLLLVMELDRRRSGDWGSHLTDGTRHCLIMFGQKFVRGITSFSFFAYFMFNNNIHKHFYYHIQSHAHTWSCLTSSMLIRFVHNLLVCVRFAFFSPVPVSLVSSQGQSNICVIWIKYLYNNVNNRSSLISTDWRTCFGEVVFQTNRKSKCTPTRSKCFHLSFFSFFPERKRET
jgi:hypothetical protein